MTTIETGSELIPDATRDGQTIRCRITDDLNVQNVPWAKVVLSKLIKDHKPQTLTLDMSDVSFVDSSGLATLVQAKKLMPGGGRIVLEHTAAPVRGLIQIAHLERLFEFPDAQDAAD